MTSKEYADYLRTEQWRNLSRQRIEIDDWHCAMCGSRGAGPNRLEVHHFTYRNLGHENPYTDLVTLCHACHKAVHRMMERPTGYGRHGWRSERHVPSIHVFSLTGEETEWAE